MEDYKVENLFLKVRDAHPDWGGALPEKFEIIEKDLIGIMKEFKCEYPKDFIDFQLSLCRITPMGDFAWDGFGWANDSFSPYMSLREVVKDARSIGVPDFLAPFRSDNGDYFCFDTRSGSERIVIWDHNSYSIDERKEYIWKNFEDWLIASFDF